MKQEGIDPSEQPFDILADVQGFDGDGLAIAAVDAERHRLIELMYFRTLMPDVAGVDVPGVVSVLDPALRNEIMSIINADLTPMFGRAHGATRKFFPSDPILNVRAQLD